LSRDVQARAVPRRDPAGPARVPAGLPRLARRDAPPRAGDALRGARPARHRLDGQSHRRQRRRRRCGRHAALGPHRACAHRNDGHVKEVKLLGLARRLMQRYRAMSEQFYREDRGISLRRAGWGYALSLVASGAFYGCYAVMALTAAAGRLTLGNLSLYVMAFR